MGEVVGLITARGGSKGVPRKNLKLLAGKPLIAWTIESARQSRRLDRVIVSTEDEEIADISRRWGAEVPFMRPVELAQDDSPHILVVEHAIRWLQEHDEGSLSRLLLLQPTSPLRTAEDIDAAIELAESRDAEAVVSVCQTEHHPYLVKRILPDGTLDDFMKPDLAYPRRQDLPPAYALNGAIYLSRIESLLSSRTFLPKGIFPYIMPPERSLDINSAWDFYVAELVLRGEHATIG